MYCLEDEKIMLDGLRKVVHIEVYDFDSDAMAYAVDSHKNQFGYKYNVKYLGQKGEVIKEEPEVNPSAFLQRAWRDCHGRDAGQDQGHWL
jgi:hypothetical protein